MTTITPAQRAAIRGGTNHIIEAARAIKHQVEEASKDTGDHTADIELEDEKIYTALLKILLAMDLTDYIMKTGHGRHVNGRPVDARSHAHA